MNFINRPTRNLFFTGKGGVGKTSLACAAAVVLADRGKKVLLVSTDPASNLDEVLGVRLADKSTPVPDIPSLYALNVNPEQAARDYRERVVAPYRGVLPDAAIASMEEQLSGSCTVEIAAFDQFSRLLGDANATAEFDHVLFDTAPTGHTLRLLSLPSAWTGFIESNTTGTSCLGPLAGLQGQRLLYQAAVVALSDSGMTTLILVSRPELSALVEAARTSGELTALGIANQHLVINGIFQAQVPDDPLAQSLERRGKEAMLAMPGVLASLPNTQLPLVPHKLLGIAALRSFLQDPGGPASFATAPDAPVPLPPPLTELVDEIAAGGHGVVLAMGKGGVGKTTVAAAIAVELARRGHQVHLTTTDPAAHVNATVGQGFPGLSVSRIDPVAETRSYQHAVLATAGVGLDVQGLRLAGGGLAFALHGGDRCIPSLCPGCRRRQEALRCSRYSAHRPHHSTIGCRPGISPGAVSAVYAHVGCSSSSLAAPARSFIHEDLAGHTSGGNPRPRGRQAAR